VRLTSDEFSAWAEPLYQSLGEKLTWTKVSIDADFHGVTISMQRTRNQVDPQIIINVARKRGLEPLEQLGRIPRWNYLSAVRSTPSQLEIIASLSPAHVYRELADRLLINAPRHSDFGPWDAYHGRLSTWVDVAGPDNARDVMRRELQLRTSSSLSRKLNSHSKFDADEAIDGFTAAGMDPVYALVLANVLTPQEAGYSDTIREDALLSISDEDLLHLCQRQVRYTSRLLADNRVAEEHLRKLQ